MGSQIREPIAVWCSLSDILKFDSNFTRQNPACVVNCHMDNWYHATLQTPIEWLRISGHDGGLTEVKFFAEEPEASSGDLPDCVAEAKAQLQAYFAGELQEFDLPLAPEGTAFQSQVWNALIGVEFGKTASYLDLALAIQNEKAVRAVGAANGRNPIAIVVPCHRVIGSNGKLTGYASGLWRKEWLLNHERRQHGGFQQTLF